MNNMAKMNELVLKLNKASDEYYNNSREIMSNFEFDKLYDELLELEKETGTTYSNSPTISVGYKVSDTLLKQTHRKKMLSLQKTKNANELLSFLEDKIGILSWKLDGLTVVIKYENGELVQGVTRGNGEVGEVITDNVKQFIGVPLTIPFKGSLIVRGEAFIRYSDFKEINSRIPQERDKYKNPRNLCSGAVRQLDTKKTKERKVNFQVFELNEIDNSINFESHLDEFKWLEEIGFNVVEHSSVKRSDLSYEMKQYERRIETLDIPVDGLVLLYDKVSLGEQLGATNKFPRNAKAFKWGDLLQTTNLIDVEWSASRTGDLNPVAIFEPVELEGTTVSRASIHNVSIFRNLQLGVGDEITVYKANMIIPQVDENLTRSNTLEIPTKCPVCGGDTKITTAFETSTLSCTNKDCPAKLIKSLAKFCSKDALDFSNLSEQTLEKLIDLQIVDGFLDLFQLDKFKDEIVNAEGLGEKSYQRIIKGINDKLPASLYSMLYGVSIKGVGHTASKLIIEHFDNNIPALMNAPYGELLLIDGIGPTIARDFVDYFNDPYNYSVFETLAEKYTAYIPKNETNLLYGDVFVITGKLNSFKNRVELVDSIEKNGGEVTKTVNKNTTYLINNDNLSTSAKNKKAHELGIRIITEQEFIDLLKEEDGEIGC